MSKFCGNCGATLDDAAVVCGYCGAPLNAGATATNQGINKAGVASVVKELLSNKIVKIALPSVAALVVVLIVVFAFVLPNTGAKGAVKDFMKAYEAQDSEALVAYASALVTDDEDEDSIEALQEISDEHFEHVEDTCGSDLKIKYEITKCEELSKGKLSDYKDMFDELDIDSSSVEEGRTLKIRIEYKGDKRDKTRNISMIMLKEDGEWKFYDDEFNVYSFD